MGSTSDGERPWQSYHTVFTNAKAGMDGVDKEKVQRVVYEMSKGSKYFENEQRKEAYIKHKIESLRAQCAKLTEKDISHYQMIADQRVLELELARDLSKFWLHSDMDAFYAAVETLEDPSLKGKPLAVGSMSMICTANYEARKFGVRAAMPGFIARKLCPDLIFVPTNFQKYTHYSELTRKVFQKFDVDFIATSLDEAYLNITNICMEKNVGAEEIAAELRSAIYEETGLTCSAGVAPNRLLAKVCSDINKPNGQYVLPNDRMAVMAFISSLPIRKIGGIGKVTEHILKDVLGINNCEDMLQKSALICALFSRCSSDFFLSVGLGLGQTETPEFKCRKSMSCEKTFSATDDELSLFKKLEEISVSLSNDMKKESLSGRTLTLKLKTSSFEVRTRASSLQKFIQSKEEILTHASKLLKAELPVSLRLIGLRLSQFQEDRRVSLGSTQKTLTSFVTTKAMSKCTFSVDSANSPDIKDDLLIHESESDFSAANRICLSADICSNCITCNSDNPEEYNNLGINSIQNSCSNDVQQETCSHNKEQPEKPLVEDEMEMTVYTNESVSSDDRGKLMWVDNYICSVCGIEIPDCFMAERQEHFDYHIAEMLQEEESKGISRDRVLQDGITRRICEAKARPGKKLKSSPRGSKNLSIDSYFTKNANKF